MGDDEEVAILVEGFTDVLDGSCGHEWGDVNVGEWLAGVAVDDEDAAVGLVEGAGLFPGWLGDLFGTVTVNVEDAAVREDGAAVDTLELEICLPIDPTVGGVDLAEDDLALFQDAMVDEEILAVWALEL